MKKALFMTALTGCVVAGACLFFFDESCAGTLVSCGKTAETRLDSVVAAGAAADGGEEAGLSQYEEAGQSLYEEISYPTPNFDPEKRNSVEGVILHHTAEPTVESSLRVLTVSKRHVGTHCVIDTDGTRYIMCEPEVVTFHAGKSVLNGKAGCNDFTIGIEFQGNTLERPLTKDQIKSAIEYLRPIIAKYKIPLRNIVTHEMVRNAYKERFPGKRCSGKVDITQGEYRRFMKELRSSLEK